MHCNKYCENIYCNYRYERMDNKSSPGGRTVKWPKTPSPMEGGVTIESMEKGYDTRCTDDLFSQGQWQLLSIARAAAAAPSMLLFDEITANLDAETERAVLSALKRVAENRTVISISHRTSAELGRIIALTD